MASVNGELLRQLILENYRSQADFAEKVGISQSYVNRLSNGRADCSIKTLAKIAKELRVSVKLLIKED